MMRVLLSSLLYLMLSTQVWAATDVVNVYFLSMQEAADAAKSQLSSTGKVAAIASQRLLIIDDDKTHIAKAKALLKRIDRTPGQYTAYLSIEDVSAKSLQQTQINAGLQAGRLGGVGKTRQAALLAGGWVQLKLQQQSSHSQHRQSFQLRLSNNQTGSIETGSLQSFGRTTRLWLAGYGVVPAQSVQLIPVTSGFHITVSNVGVDKLRVRIRPWMQRSQASLQGQPELLLGLGDTGAPNTPPGNTADMRLNAQPVMQREAVIELSGASTELMMSVDQSVSLGAINSEAEQLGQTLLSRFSSIGKRRLVMHLRITKN